MAQADLGGGGRGDGGVRQTAPVRGDDRDGTAPRLQTAGIFTDKYKAIKEMRDGKGNLTVRDPDTIINNITVVLKTLKERVPGSARYVPGLRNEWLTGRPASEDFDEDDE
jgi:hypothetical protein